MLSLGVLGVLAQSAHLNARDKEVNQVTFLAQGLLEQSILQASDMAGYQALASSPYRVSGDPDFIYAVDVATDIPGTKKIAVMVYYHDRNDSVATSVDPRRPNQGLAICLTCVVGNPRP